MKNNDKYIRGTIPPNKNLNEVCGQFFYCNRCQSYNVKCSGLEAFMNKIIITGTCEDCHKKTIYPIAQYNEKQYKMILELAEIEDEKINKE